MLSALGAVITGTVPVAVVLLWLIWREQRRLAEVEREKMRRAARKARQQEEPDRGGS
jgi:heme exporter protein D